MHSLTTPKPLPYGRAMGCLSWVIQRTMTAIYREHTCALFWLNTKKITLRLWRGYSGASNVVKTSSCLSLVMPYLTTANGWDVDESWTISFRVASRSTVSLYVRPQSDIVQSAGLINQCVYWEGRHMIHHFEYKKFPIKVCQICQRRNNTWQIAMRCYINSLGQGQISDY